MRAYIVVIPDTDDALAGFEYRYEPTNIDPPLLMPGQSDPGHERAPMMYGEYHSITGRFDVHDRYRLHRRGESGLTADGVRMAFDAALQLAIEEIMLTQRDEGWIT